MTDTDEVMPGFPTRKKFARDLGVCERTVMRAEERGEVITVRVGNLRFVDVERTREIWRSGKRRERRGGRSP